jgi:uridine kinase
MDKNLINYYDYKIWVDCPPEVGQERALARDGETFKELWINKWIPETITYINEQRPDKKADTVINYKDIDIFK